MSSKIITQIGVHHTNYLKMFHNKKLCGLVGVIGMFSGITHCATYYTKASWNYAIDEVNSEENKSVLDELFGLKNEKDKQKLELDNFKYKSWSVFDYVIIPDAPLGLNLFTTGMTGAVLGYGCALYFPVTIGGVLMYNIIRPKPPQPFWVERQEKMILKDGK